MPTSPQTLNILAHQIEAIPAERWESELQKSASRYHTIGAWVAILFDPIFGVTDYLNIPEDWLQVFVLRISVALFTLVALYFHKRKKISTYFFISVPLFLISIQNAYTYSLIGPENLLGHNLNYLALFLGAGLFILWPLVYSLIAIGVSAAASFGFILLNESIDSNSFAENGGVLLITAVIFSILLIQARYTSKANEIKARLALGDSLITTRLQKEEIEQKNGTLEEQAIELEKAKSQIEDYNARLIDQNELLEELVYKRTAKLRKTSAERDQFVYRLSHDFRTPMVNIRSLLSMAMKMPDESSREMLFERIDASFDQFDSLIRDMESFPVYARGQLKLEEIDPELEIRSVWDNLANLRSEGDSLTIQNRLEGKMNTDAEKFRLIARVLLANSLRYRIPEQAAKVELRISSEGEKLQLQLRDQGSGIPEAVLPKVFEMFFRGDPRSKGAGLGLYLANGLAAQLGGQIAIHSEENKGTEVVLTFEKVEG